MASAPCPHGFAPGSCLICQTLGVGSSPAAKAVRHRGDQKPARGARAPAPPPGVHVLPAPKRRLTLGRLLGLAVVAVAVLVGLWWVTVVAAAVLRFVELGAVAFVTGYVGWLIGVRHGRRSR